MCSILFGRFIFINSLQSSNAHLLILLSLSCKIHFVMYLEQKASSAIVVMDKGKITMGVLERQLINVFLSLVINNPFSK